MRKYFLIFQNLNNKHENSSINFFDDKQKKYNEKFK